MYGINMETNSYNSLINSLLEFQNDITEEKLYKDLKLIDTLSFNKIKALIPIYNYFYLKQISKNHLNDFQTKTTHRLYFNDLKNVLNGYTFILIMSFITILIPIVCVWTLLSSDMYIVCIAISVIAPILAIAFYFWGYLLVKGNYWCFDNDIPRSLNYYQQIRAMLYEDYLIYFKYFYKKTNQGIGINKPNEFILDLNNGEHYCFDNFIDLYNKLKSINKDLLLLKEDVVFKKERHILVPKVVYDFGDEFDEENKKNKNPNKLKHNYSENFIFSNNPLYKDVEIEQWNKKIDDALRYC